MDIINNLTGLALRKLEFLDRGETYIVYSTYDRLWVIWPRAITYKF